MYNSTVLCVCVCVFIKLHITAQSGPVILVILCHSHVCVCVLHINRLGLNHTQYNIRYDCHSGTWSSGQELLQSSNESI